MSWFYWQILLVSLGITVGLVIAFKGYSYLLKSVRKTQTYIPKVILHSLEDKISKGELLFHFELMSNQKIIFEICNDAFESVKILKEGELTEGSHTQHFDSTQLANGTYFYRLKGEQQQVMKKMVVENSEIKGRNDSSEQL